MENKIVAYQVGPNSKISIELIKEIGFTNKDYLGHTKDTNIPVYFNKYLRDGETKIIMEKNFEKLPAGNYKAIVTQIIEKPEEEGKIRTSIELDVKDHTNKTGKFEYITLFRKGYSDMQMEISKKTEEDLLDRFSIQSLEDLVNKEVALTSKINDKGYTHYFLYTPKSFTEWKTDIKLPCKIKKIYESKDGQKYNVHVKVDMLGKEVDDFVTYRKDNEIDSKNFEFLLKKTNLTLEQIGKDNELDLDAFFEVVHKKSKKDSKKVYTNKRIKFAREERAKRESVWGE